MFRDDPDLNALDDIALALSNRTGNPGNWFFGFRVATSGMLARQASAHRSYRLLTEWLPGLPLRSHEQELAVCVFGMDSAIECWAYALNALGFGASEKDFLDVRSESALKRISPENVIGATPLPGYPHFFPSVLAVWKDHETSIRIIMANHDVSKHRHSTFAGGKSRSDAPPDLLQAFGVTDAVHLPFHSVPMESLIISKRPKLPVDQRSGDRSDWIELNALKESFDHLLRATAAAAHRDAAVNIK